MSRQPETRSSRPALFGEDVLIRRAREGDMAAFEQLYRHHAGPIFGLCLRMVADRSRAEELTQAAFVRAWTKLDSFRGESAFGTWLHRLTVNVVLSDRRSRSRREDREQELEPENLTEDSVPRVLEKSTDIDLERAIASLPPRARQVLVLFDIHGYLHREIAELLGIEEGTSKAQLNRARRLVREALER